MPPRKTLLATLLSLLLGCGSLPLQPDAIQYGVHADITPPGFYGTHNKTYTRVFKSFQAPEMKGAQCLSASDYKAYSAWIQSIEQMAFSRCR